MSEVQREPDLMSPDDEVIVYTVIIHKCLLFSEIPQNIL